MSAYGPKRRTWPCAPHMSAFGSKADAALTWPVATRAQQPERMRRIGVLMPYAKDNSEGRARIAAFISRVRSTGPPYWRSPTTRCRSCRTRCSAPTSSCKPSTTRPKRPPWQTKTCTGSQRLCGRRPLTVRCGSRARSTPARCGSTTGLCSTTNPRKAGTSRAGPGG